MRSAKLRGWANTAPTQIGLKTASDQQASADGATSIPTTRHILQHVGREVRRTSLVSLSIPRPRHVLRTRRAPSHAPSPLTLASSRSSSRQRRKSRASTCPKRCVRSFSRLSFGSELTHGPLGCCCTGPKGRNRGGDDRDGRARHREGRTWASDPVEGWWGRRNDALTAWLVR